MLAEALEQANEFIKVPGRGASGEVVARKMSECVSDFHAYWRLGESIVKQIENSFDPVST